MTNPSSMVALRNLNGINRRLDTVQNKVSTGLKVSGALDDASNFSIAQGIRGEIRAIAAVTQAINGAKGVLKVALAGTTAVSNLVTDLKAKIIEGSNPANTAQQQAILNNDYKAMVKQMRQIMENSGFNGVNLTIEVDLTWNMLSGIVRTLQVPMSADGTTKTIQGYHLDQFWALMDNENLATTVGANSALTTLDGNMTIVNSALGGLGADLRALNLQTAFLDELSDATEEGLANIVDADLARESATLTAIQIQQQLATQTLSIANRAPEGLLGLFQ